MKVDQEHCPSYGCEMQILAAFLATSFIECMPYPPRPQRDNHGELWKQSNAADHPSAAGDDAMTPRSHLLLSRLLIAGTLAAGAVPATAGAPLLRETCVGPDRRPVPTRYDSRATPYFAQARWIGSQSVIVVNPEVYFLGQSTQQWLYFRQCVHIQRQHPLVRDGDRALNPEHEELADCEALRAMDRLPGAGQSTRTLRMSIESDMGRLLRSDQWARVLAGPQRRILFDRCPA